jgi:hypothetical protein
MAFLNWCYQAKARFEVDQPLLTEVPRKSTFRQLRNPDVWMGQVAGNTVLRDLLAEPSCQANSFRYLRTKGRRVHFVLLK